MPQGHCGWSTHPGLALILGLLLSGVAVDKMLVSESLRTHLSMLGGVRKLPRPGCGWAEEIRVS